MFHSGILRIALAYTFCKQRLSSSIDLSVTLLSLPLTKFATLILLRRDGRPIVDFVDCHDLSEEDRYRPRTADYHCAVHLYTDAFLLLCLLCLRDSFQIRDEH